MEKYSAYRDPGTGIQPFLPPVPPQTTEAIALKCLKPLTWTLALLRMSVVILLGLLYWFLVSVVCLPLSLVLPHSAAEHIITATIGRLTLFVLGFVRINVEIVSRKRGPGRSSVKSSWKPKAGDIIVSNWISYLEIIWLAFRFNPTFVLPISYPPKSPPVDSSPIRSTPNKRAMSGSAAPSSASPARRAAERAPVSGFRTVSLWGMLNATGYAPPYKRLVEEARSLEDVRLSSRTPIVVFPECTTSNGRGLLRFAEVFENISIPVKKFNVFIMSVRIDPPTQLSPTVSVSIPCRFKLLNPLPHMFTLAASILPYNLTVRLLAQSDGPSSEAFMVSNSLTGEPRESLSEVCAMLVGEIGRMKRVGLGWEDKARFIDLYNLKSR